MKNGYLQLILALPVFPKRLHLSTVTGDLSVLDGSSAILFSYSSRFIKA